MDLKINHLAVIVCTILSMVIPVAWYSLFADQWMNLNGFSLEFVEENSSPKLYISALLSGLIGSYVLAWLWQKMSISSIVDGVIAALAIGFGLLFLTGMVHNMFEYRPYGLSWINGGGTMLWMVVSGIILATWRKYT